MTDPKLMARATDPDTSHEAAQRVNATALETLVLDIIRSYPEGCTSDEILWILPDHRIDSVSPRYAALLRKGYIIDTGERRKARSGRSQRVMKAVAPEDVKPLNRLTSKAARRYAEVWSIGYGYAIAGIDLWLTENSEDLNAWLVAESLLEFMALRELV
jgi:hypothetical protein